MTISFSLPSAARWGVALVAALALLWTGVMHGPDFIDGYLEERNAIALMEAAWEGDTDAASRLIDAGADLNVRNSDGETALIKAALRGHTDIACLLIDAGADPNARSNYGWTALRWATRRDHTDIARLLEQAGARK